jgi:hypothetical protein
MPREAEATVMVSTRIPKELHRRMRLHCVTRETKMMDFVTAAIDEALRKSRRQKKHGGA